MKQTIRDANGRIACVADPLTGIIEIKYNKIFVHTTLEIGKSLTIERGGAVTTLTRLSAADFHVAT